MIEGGFLVVVLILLVSMALLAGIGIGLVAGLAASRRDDAQDRPADSMYGRPGLPQALPVTSSAVAPVEYARPTTTGGLAAFPAGAGFEAAPRRRVPDWSVALAIAVIVVCCCCTFLLAAVAAAGS